jgi:hypothetical protein
MLLSWWLVPSIPFLKREPTLGSYSNLYTSSTLILSVTELKNMENALIKSYPTVVSE